MMKKVLAVIMTAALLLVLLAIPASAAGVEFDDVSESSYYYGAVTRWSDAGVVSGYEDGTFRPEDFVKRNEFAKILCAAFGAPTNSTLNPFTDVVPKADGSAKWDTKYVLGAYAAGWMNGKRADYFDRKSEVTREEAFVVFARAMGIAPLRNEEEIASILGEYTDGDRVHDYARGATAACIKEGLATGKGNNRIAPRDPLKRCELVKMLDNITGNAYDRTSGEYTEKGYYVTEGTDGKDVSAEGYVIVNTPEAVTLNGANRRVAVAPGSSGSAEEDGGPLTVEDAEIANLFVNASDYVVVVNNGEVKSLVIPETAENVTVIVKDGASVDEIVADGDGVTVMGGGKVGKVLANGEDIDVQTPRTVVTAGPASKNVTAGDAEVKPGEEKSVTFDDAGEQGLTPQPYDKTKRTVTFDYNYDGAKSSSVRVAIGESVDEPEKPYREGYLFEGWFVNKEELLGEKAYDFSQKVSSSMTLYAHWIENEYDVTVKEATLLGGEVYAPAVKDLGKGVYELSLVKPDDVVPFLSECIGTMSEESVPGHYFQVTMNVDPDDVPEDAKYTIVGNGVTAIKKLQAANPLVLRMEDADAKNEFNVTIDWGNGLTQDLVIHLPEDPALTYAHAVTFVYTDTDGELHSDVLQIADGQKITGKPEDDSVQLESYEQLLGWSARLYDDNGDFVNAVELWDFDKDVVEYNAVFSPNKELVKAPVVFYDQDGKTVLAQFEVPYGEKIPAGLIPSDELTAKEGYTFEGWYDGEDPVDFETYTVYKIAGAGTVFTGKWNIITYTVLFDRNNGTANVSRVPVNYGETVAKPEDPTYEGYDFLGWFEEGKDEPFDFETKIYDNVSLKAKWEHKPVTVTFKDGDKTESKTIKYGEKVTAPTTFTKEGHDLTWLDKDGKEYDFDTEVKENIELTAQWTPKTYTVTFVDGDKKVERPVTYNETVVAPTTFTKEGYDLAWVDKDEEPFDFSTPIKGDITLTAKWTIKTYTVTFVDGEKKVEKKVTHGAQVQAPASFVKEGYDLSWTYEDEEPFSFETPITEDLKLVAKWTAHPYTVSFNIQGHGAVVSPQTVNYGGKVTKVADLTADGFTFGGWYKDENCSYVWDFENDTVSEDTILYAKWTINKYTVTFDSNGGSAVAAQEVEYNQAAVEPADPTREGFVFNGWTLDGKAYEFSTPVSKDITLKADWTKLFTVTFNVDGEAVKTVDVQDGGTIVAADFPADPEKSGYKFAGWFDDDAELVVGTQIAADVEVEAKWIQLFTVTFKKFAEDTAAYDEKIVADGEIIALEDRPVAPKSNGYLFAGWTYVDGTTEFNFEAPVTADTLVIAKWTPELYTVKFNQTTANAVPYGDYSVTEFAKPVPTSTGALVSLGEDFAPYVKEADGNFVAITANLKQEDEGKVVPSTLQIVAEPEIVRYSHSTGSDNYTFVVPLDALENDEFTLTFKWDNNPEHDSVYTIDTSKVAIGRLVTFVDEVGFELAEPAQVADGDMVVEPEIDVEGYYVNSWTLNGEEYNFDTPVTANIELVGTLAKIPYTVTFVTGTEEEIAPQTVEFEDTIAEPAISRVGYDLLYWAVDSEDGEAYVFGTPVTADMTLYAVWDIKKLNVTYVYNNGQPDSTIQVEYGDVLYKPADPVQTAYAFHGWYVDEEPYDFSQEVTEDLILTADWVYMLNKVDVVKVDGADYYKYNVDEIVDGQELDGDVVPVTVHVGEVLEYVDPAVRPLVRGQFPAGIAVPVPQDLGIDGYQVTLEAGEEDWGFALISRGTIEDETTDTVEVPVDLNDLLRAGRSAYAFTLKWTSGGALVGQEFKYVVTFVDEKRLILRPYVTVADGVETAMSLNQDDGAVELVFTGEADGVTKVVTGATAKYYEGDKEITDEDILAVIAAIPGTTAPEGDVSYAQVKLNTPAEQADAKASGWYGTEETTTGFEYEAKGTGVKVTYRADFTGVTINKFHTATYESVATGTINDTLETNPIIVAENGTIELEKGDVVTAVGENTFVKWNVKVGTAAAYEAEVGDTVVVSADTVIKPVMGEKRQIRFYEWLNENTGDGINVHTQIVGVGGKVEEIDSSAFTRTGYTKFLGWYTAKKNATTNEWEYTAYDFNTVVPAEPATGLDLIGLWEAESLAIDKANVSPMGATGTLDEIQEKVIPGYTIDKNEAVAGEVNSFKVDFESLLKHQNGDGLEGYWVGTSIVAPEGATGWTGSIKIGSKEYKFESLQNLDEKVDRAQSKAGVAPFLDYGSTSYDLTNPVEYAIQFKYDESNYSPVYHLSVQYPDPATKAEVEVNYNLGTGDKAYENYGLEGQTEVTETMKNFSQIVPVGKKIAEPAVGSYQVVNGDKYWIFKEYEVTGDAEKAEDGYVVNGDTTFKYLWDTTYAVTFKPNGGATTTKDVVVLTKGEYTLPEYDEIFTAKADYRFKEWATVIGVAPISAAKKAGYEIQVTANTTVTAIWDKLYSVTLNAGYGIGDNENTQADETYNTVLSNAYAADDEFVGPALPEGWVAPDGYKLVGWTKTQNGKTADVKVDETVANYKTVNGGTAADITLYAVWEAEIAFEDSDAAEGLLGAAGLKELENFALDVNGDNNELTIATKGEDFVVYTTGNTEGFSSLPNGHYIAVKATSPVAINAVKFYNQGYPSGVAAYRFTDEGKKEAIVAIRIVDALKTNPEFTIVFETAMGNATYKLNVKDVALGYTVQYNANTGTGEKASETKVAGSKVELPAATTFGAPEKQLFLTWHVYTWNAADSKFEYSAAYEPGTEFEVTADSIVYAVWANGFTVTKSTELGDAEPVVSGLVIDGGTYNDLSVPAELIPEGYTFYKWYVETGSGTASTGAQLAADGEIENITDDVELVALWYPTPVFEPSTADYVGTLNPPRSAFASVLTPVTLGEKDAEGVIPVTAANPDGVVPFWVGNGSYSTAHYVALNISIPADFNHYEAGKVTITPIAEGETALVTQLNASGLFDKVTNAETGGVEENKGNFTWLVNIDKADRYAVSFDWYGDEATKQEYTFDFSGLTKGYTVSYAAGGNTQAKIESKTYAVGADLLLPEYEDAFTFDEKLYYVKGYNVKVGDTTTAHEAGDTIKITADTVISADLGNVRKVTLKDGFDTEAPTEIGSYYIHDGDPFEFSTAFNPKHEGYQFKSWTADPTTTVKEVVDETGAVTGYKVNNVTADLTLTATFDQLYTAELVYNFPGVEKENKVIEEAILGTHYDVPAGLPEDWAAPEGYTFGGWFYGDVNYAGETGIMGPNDKFMAHWIPDLKYVRFTGASSDEIDGLLTQDSLASLKNTYENVSATPDSTGKVWSFEIKDDDGKDLVIPYTKDNDGFGGYPTGHYILVTAELPVPVDAISADATMKIVGNVETNYNVKSAIDANTTNKITFVLRLDDVKTSKDSKFTVTYDWKNGTPTDVYTLDFSAVKLGYTVTYSANGGAFTPAVEPVVVEAGDPIPVPETEITPPANRRFGSWFVLTEGSWSGAKTINAQPTMPASDVTLAPGWTTVYTVTMSDGYGAPAATVDLPEQYAKDDVLTLPGNPFTRDNYEFKGWKLSVNTETIPAEDETGTTITADTTIVEARTSVKMPGEALTLTAVWAPKASFVGSTEKGDKLVSNPVAVVASEPTDANLVTLTSENVIPYTSGNATQRANGHFVAVKATMPAGVVIDEVTGTTGTHDDKNKHFDVVIDTANKNEALMFFRLDYAVSGNPFTVTFKSTGNEDSVYTIDVSQLVLGYTVTVNATANGAIVDPGAAEDAEAETTKSVVVPAGTKVEINPESTSLVLDSTTVTVEPDGQFDFTGWTPAGIAGEDGKSYLEIAKDETITAGWQEYYLITYVAGADDATLDPTKLGDVNENNVLKVIKGNSITLPPVEAASRPGYNFTHWTMTKPNWSGDRLPNAVSQPDANLTITPKWEPNGYDVTFDLDGGNALGDGYKVLNTNSAEVTPGDGEAVKIAYDTTITLPTVAQATKAGGYVLEKWEVTVGDAAATRVNPGDPLKISAATTVKAIWKDLMGTVAVAEATVDKSTSANAVFGDRTANDAPVNLTVEALQKSDATHYFLGIQITPPVGLGIVAADIEKANSGDRSVINPSFADGVATVFWNYGGSTPYTAKVTWKDASGAVGTPVVYVVTPDVTTLPDTYSVTIMRGGASSKPTASGWTAGTDATSGLDTISKTFNRGESIDEASAIVVAPANDNFYFDREVVETANASSHGLTVAWVSEQAIKVYGTPAGTDSSFTISLPGASWKNKPDTPTDVTFVATGTDKGTLTGATTAMEYSVDSGTTYVAIEDASAEITGVDATKDVLVRIAATETTLASDPQTVAVEAAPTAPAVTVGTVTVVGKWGYLNIDGWTDASGNTYEFSTDGTSWTTADVDNGTITNIPTYDSYYVRIKASGNKLASGNSAKTTVAYVAVKPTSDQVNVTITLEGGSQSYTTGADGKLTSADLADLQDRLSGKFDGFYTEDGKGIEIDVDENTVFASDTNLFARYRA